MKTWTANFTTKVEKLQGEQPCKLVHINYGTSSHLYLTDADQSISLGGNTYYPYILSMGSLSFEMPEEDVIGTVTNLDIQIMRNATTDVLLNNLTKNRNVEIWQYFIGLADADKSALATLIVENVADTTQSQFTLKLKQNELLIKEIPIKDLNIIDYPYLLDENLGLGVPIVLGLVSTQFSADIRKSYRSQKNSSVAALCSHKLDYKFLGHKLAGVTVGGRIIYRVYKFESAWNLYAYLEADTIGQSDGHECYTVDTSDNGIAIDLNSPFDTYPGDRRKIFVAPDREGQNNTATEWKNAFSLNTIVDCTIPNAGVLELSWSNKDSFLRNSTCVQRYLLIQIDAISSSGWAHVYFGRYGGSETSLAVETTNGNKSYDVASLIDFDTYSLSDYYVKIEAGGGTSQWVDISDICLEIIYKDGMSVLESYRGIIITGGFIVETGEIKTRKILESTINQIFFEMQGVLTEIKPNSTAYTYNTPAYCFYALLNFICGIVNTEIDGNSTDSAYSHLNTLGLTNCGLQIKETQNAMEYLKSLLTQSMLKTFRGYDNKFKLFKTNKAESYSIPVFRDLDEHDALTSPAMVYQMTDFVFYQSENFYNKFVLNYHYNPGRNIYDMQVIKDRNNDTDLDTSYDNYNSDERLFELNCTWLRTSTVAINLFTALKKYWKQTKLIVEFDTNLVGTKLELGDSFQTNHKAQTWNSNDKTFQAIGIEQSGNSIHLKGIEIIP